MAIEKQLNTRIQLKYDSLSNWNEHGGVILKKGEIALCAVPTGGSAVSGDLNRPQVLFKVGDGSSTFANLPWASATAADVYAWAKQATLPVIKNGTGNVVSNIYWDEANKGIKFDTASVATSESLEEVQNNLSSLTTKVNAMYTNEQIDAAVADAKKAGTDAAAALATYKTSNDQAVAEAKQAGTDAAAALETYKGTNDQAVATINTNITNIVNGTTTVAKATQATNDGNGKDIAATYQTIENATLQHTEMSGKIEDLEKAVEDINDDKDGILAQAQAYADQAEADAITSANGYTDGKIDTLKTEVVSNTTFSEFKTANTQAIADAAQTVKDEAQGAINTLAAKVGEVPADKTVVQMISDAQTAATYDDTQVKADIQTNANAIAANKTELEGKINSKVAQADYDAKVEEIKGTTDSLQTQINTIMNNPDTEGVINSINEFTQYIADHGEIADGFRADINANAKAISDHEALATQTYETKEDAVAKYDELTELVNTKAVQADWNENDETSPAYIKNRPFYEIPAEENIVIFEGAMSNDEVQGTFKEALRVDHNYTVIVDGTTYENLIAYGNSDSASISDWNYLTITTDVAYGENYAQFQDSDTHDVKIILKSRAFNTILEHTYAAEEFSTSENSDTGVVTYRISGIEGDFIGYAGRDKFYNVTLDGVTYKNVPCVNNYYDHLGDSNLEAYPFSIWFTSSGTNLTVTTPGPHHIRIDQVLSEDFGPTIVQLDEKFIPDTIARVTDIKALKNVDAAMAERLDAVEAQLGDGEGSVADMIAVAKTELEGKIADAEAELEGKIADAETAAANQAAVVLAEAQKASAAAEEAAKAHADDILVEANENTTSAVAALKTTLEQADKDIKDRLDALEGDFSDGVANEATKVSNALTVTMEDSTVKTFDGSAAVAIDLTNLATKAYADQAEADALSKANKNITSAITTLQTSLEQADTDLSDRITTLETDHIKTITAGDGLKVTSGTNSATIAFDDECVFIINCGSSTELV